MMKLITVSAGRIGLESESREDNKVLVDVWTNLPTEPRGPARAGKSGFYTHKKTKYRKHKCPICGLYRAFIPQHIRHVHKDDVDAVKKPAVSDFRKRVGEEFNGGL